MVSFVIKNLENLAKYFITTEVLQPINLSGSEKLCADRVMDKNRECMPDY